MLKVGLEQELSRLPKVVNASSLFYYRLIPDLLLYGCMIVVLTDSLKNADRAYQKRRTILRIFVWALAVVMTLFVVAQGMRTIYYF